jgi:hypothetical protein
MYRRVSGVSQLSRSWTPGSWILTEIALNTRRSDTLRDDAEALFSYPGDQYLGRILLALGRDLGDLGRIHNSGFPGDVVAKRGVGGEMDSLVFAVGCESDGT